MHSSRGPILSALALYLTHTKTHKKSHMHSVVCARDFLSIWHVHTYLVFIQKCNVSKSSFSDCTRFFPSKFFSLFFWFQTLLHKCTLKTTENVKWFPCANKRFCSDRSIDKWKTKSIGWNWENDRKKQITNHIAWYMQLFCAWDGCVHVRFIWKTNLKCRHIMAMYTLL